MVKKEETAKSTATKKASPKKTTTKAAPAKKVVKRVKSASAPVSHGVGRRKSAIARVWLRKRGTGKITVNQRDYKKYFDTEIARLEAAKPIVAIPSATSFDIDVNVSGGGLHAQAGAIKLGIARALASADSTLRPMLRKHGFLTVDSRVKERKKYGQKAARRKFQFVKR